MTRPSRPHARRWRALTRQLTGRGRSAPTPERVWTAAELEAMPPAERDALVRSGFVTDPTKVPSDLVDRARRKADAHIAVTERRGDPC